MKNAAITLLALSVAAAPLAAQDPVLHSRSDLAETTRQDDGFDFGDVVHAIGGALVGGWVGFVGAQVVHSDWDKSSNSALSSQRSAWVAGGAAIGILGSWLIGETGTPGPGPMDVQPQPMRGRNVITAKQIAESGAMNAYELINTLRKDWLQTRGTNSWGESARGSGSGSGGGAAMTVVPGRDKVIVYYDGIRLGGVDDMREIPVEPLTSVQFFDGRQATMRFGSGHAHGAILLSTEVEAP